MPRPVAPGQRVRILRRGRLNRGRVLGQCGGLGGKRAVSDGDVTCGLLFLNHAGHLPHAFFRVLAAADHEAIKKDQPTAATSTRQSAARAAPDKLTVKRRGVSLAEVFFNRTLRRGWAMNVYLFQSKFVLQCKTVQKVILQEHANGRVAAAALRDVCTALRAASGPA